VSGELVFLPAGFGPDAVPYQQGWDLQREIHALRVAGQVGDVCLLLEHQPVYTAGRRTSPLDRPAGDPGAPVIDVDRGGKITWHGPGQLVGYPIVAIDDVVGYVRLLEGALVAALAQEGVDARARPDDGVAFTGVWVGDRKIASIGVRVTRGVTTHGFAVNVENDLQPFGWIVPCGLDGVQMTSIVRETGRTAGGMKCFRRRVAWELAQALARRQRLVSLARLEALTGALQVR
jgi:lipoyl(octanoyl) transferase